MNRTETVITSYDTIELTGKADHGTGSTIRIVSRFPNAVRVIVEDENVEAKEITIILAELESERAGGK